MQQLLAEAYQPQAQASEALHLQQMLHAHVQQLKNNLKLCCVLVHAGVSSTGKQPTSTTAGTEASAEHNLDASQANSSKKPGLSSSHVNLDFQPMTLTFQDVHYYVPATGVCTLFSPNQKLK